MTASPLQPKGKRLEWAQLPAHVREAVEGWLGDEVATASTQPDGFSPGLAARVRTRSGRRVFVKAVGSEPNAFSPSLHRREAAIVSLLPETAPVPRLLATFDKDGWVTLVFEEAEGRHPSRPWQVEDLDLVMRALARLAASLTPSPLPAGLVPTAAEVLSTSIHGWQALSRDRPRGLDAWSAAHLERLARLEAGAPDAVQGDTLLHFDVRGDNLLLAGDRVFFVDWPWAATGPAWLDAVFFAPSVTMQGGPPPEETVARHPACAEADPEAVTRAIASVAGFFTRQALLPEEPGLPGLRAFQAAQGAVAREWLARRTGWA